MTNPADRIVISGAARNLNDGELRVPQPAADSHVRIRARLRARRELDVLLAALAAEPVELGEPIDWHAVHMDRSWTEREAIGREYARMGWCA